LSPVAVLSFFHTLVDAEAFAISENRRRLLEVEPVTEIDSKVLAGAFGAAQAALGVAVLDRVSLGGISDLIDFIENLLDCNSGRVFPPGQAV